ncbi:MAG TPA: hypothetical protein VG456_23375 [Candidatus Sulfopaludibacter sp.]|jgi:hypothetical protein|nr:hypothetical protein [Candidatus Sulfopaludibacter sp.]
MSGFSFLFHGLLALFLAAVACLALVSGGVLHLEMLPWTGSTLEYIMLFGGLCGLALIVLAILGKLRPLFFVWTLVILVLMVKGYVLGGYHFDPASAKTAGYLMGGALLAVVGGWMQMFRRSERRF